MADTRQGRQRISIWFSSWTVQKKYVLYSFYDSLPGYPAQILVSDRFKGSNLNDAFSSEQGNWIAGSDIKYWIYGHSHANIPGQIGQTTFLSNQLGYVFDHPEATGFDNGAAIEIR